MELVSIIRMRIVRFQNLYKKSSTLPVENEFVLILKINFKNIYHQGSAVSQNIVQQVSQLIIENGPALIFSAISAALFHLSNTLCKEMADIVFLIIQMDKQVFKLTKIKYIMIVIGIRKMDILRSKLKRDWAI